MNISLSPELEQFVAEKIESGTYQTIAEVIGEGLRLLRERDELGEAKLKDLRADIAIGIEQANQGRVRPIRAGETLAKIREQRKQL